LYPSSETSRIQEALKVLLKKRGISYPVLARELGVSLPTMKRMLNAEDLSIERLSRICEAINVSLHDVLELTRKPQSDLHFFSAEQERFFARNPHYLHYFLVLHGEGKSPDEIEKLAKISRRSTYRYLTVLAEMGLVHVEGRKARSRVNGLIGWDESGPLGVAVSRRSIRQMTERMTGDASVEAFVEVSGRMLSPDEYEAMKADFRALVAKYRRVSKINSTSKDLSKLGRYEMVLMADRRPSRALTDIPELAEMDSPKLKLRTVAEIRAGAAP
jgi:DNA-binding Xre family transcriptional regulator